MALKLGALGFAALPGSRLCTPLLIGAAFFQGSFILEALGKVDIWVVAVNICLHTAVQ